MKETFQGRMQEDGIKVLAKRMDAGDFGFGYQFIVGKRAPKRPMTHFIARYIYTSIPFHGHMFMDEEGRNASVDCFFMSSFLENHSARRTM